MIQSFADEYRTRCGRLCVMVISLAVTIGFAWPAMAQNEAVEPAAEVAGQGAEEEVASAPAAATDEAASPESLMDMILNSGPTGLSFMVVLIMFSLVGVAVALERAINLQRSKIIPAEFVAELNVLTENRETVHRTIPDLCARWSNPIAKILKAGLMRHGRPLPEIEKSMEDAAAREMAALRGGIRPLNIVGSIAPLVGLLGTVLGMIMAFRTASQAGLGKGEMMAEGIYMALLTTAAGLTIAIPSLLLAAMFNSKVEKFFREIDESLLEVLPCLATMQPPVEAGEAHSARNVSDAVQQGEKSRATVSEIA